MISGQKVVYLMHMMTIHNEIPEIKLKLLLDMDEWAPLLTPVEV